MAELKWRGFRGVPFDFIPSLHTSIDLGCGSSIVLSSTHMGSVELTFREALALGKACKLTKGV